MGHIVIVEDDEDSARMIGALISREGHTVSSAPTLDGARRMLAMRPADLLLLDLHLPDGNGFELIQHEELLSDTEVVLMTGNASVETSVKALRLGAADYIVKPVSPDHLKGLLSRLIRPSRLRAEIAQVAEQWRATGRFCQMVGSSPAMERVYQQVSRVAGTAVTVFIHGESGTGKELVARAVHDLSRRREQPFLAVNCGAISPNLIESEIFGHERGSFTGAERLHQGFFERAHGGTLFLDEVTEMPLELQVKLLRVLETATFMRVGSTEVRQTDVRIIAATNRDAGDAVARGVLRQDLLYRLNVFPIFLPPLRDRAGDVPALAKGFLEEMGVQEGQRKRFTPRALERLAAWPWPGNVRELRNVVQRAWVMALDEEIDEEWLPIADSNRIGARPEGGEPLHPRADGRISIAIGSQLADIERQVILATFEHCGRHRERTAAVLGISMKTLYNRLKEYHA